MIDSHCKKIIYTINFYDLNHFIIFLKDHFIILYTCRYA